MPNKTLKYLIALIFTLVVWLLWWLVLPQLMNYQEQYQLFLFTDSYLIERLSTPGGVADYISEFITQFYLIPWAGGFAIALLLSMIQMAMAKGITAKEQLTPNQVKDRSNNALIFALTFLPSIVLLAAMANENVLLSFPVAILLSLLAWLAFGKYPWLCIVIYPLLYWMLGPIALLCPLLSALQRNEWWIIPSMVLALAVPWAVNHIWMQQYPLSRLLLGINYCRIPNWYPACLFVSFAACLIPICIIKIISSRLVSALSVALVTAGIVYACTSLDCNKLELMSYDYFTRKQAWNRIIEMAEKKAPSSDFALQAVNLALGKTGQLGDRMYEFPQKGITGLIAPVKLDNTSSLITAEAFYHLGMINEAHRTNFELQEAIMNDRQSGRMMRRLAECLIVNGKYSAAEKYLYALRHSLFYRHWANNAMEYLGDEPKISQHPVWGQMRANRFKQEYLYDYPEIEKMLALLALDSEGRNKLAWDYFCAAAMLKGDLPLFTGMYHYAPELFNIQRIPSTHEEAIGIYWSMGHADFDGCPYPLSEACKTRITSFAHKFMSDQNLQGSWTEPFKNSYCLYFLKQQQKQHSAEAAAGKASGRDD